jgi:hypothetical protein
MPTDKSMIITALKLWFQKGDVFEIRVLDAVSSNWMRPHMESGYFDYDHIADAAEAITIQYGGSMNAKNAAELLSMENIDGGLIGGASLKSDDFTVIVKAAQ